MDGGSRALPPSLSRQEWGQDLPAQGGRRAIARHPARQESHDLKADCPKPVFDVVSWVAMLQGRDEAVELFCDEHPEGDICILDEGQISGESPAKGSTAEQAARPQKQGCSSKGNGGCHHLNCIIRELGGGTPEESHEAEDGAQRPSLAVERAIDVDPQFAAGTDQLR